MQLPAGLGMWGPTVWRPAPSALPGEQAGAGSLSREPPRLLRLQESPHGSCILTLCPKAKAKPLGQ